MAFPSDWRSGPGQPTFQPFFVAAVEVLGRAVQAGWLISVSCTLHFPLQLQFLSLDRSRPGRSHAMLPHPHAGEHCVTPVQAAAKETNSSPVQPKLLFVCKSPLFCFLVFSDHWFLSTILCYLISVFSIPFSSSTLWFPLSTLCVLFSGFFFPFLYTSHRQLAKSTQSNLDPPSLVHFCTHSLLSRHVFCASQV